MTLPEALTALLAPLVGGELFWDETPNGYVVPAAGCIILQDFGGKRLTYVDQTLAANQPSRVQIECWTKRRADTNALANLVEQTILASDLIATPYNAPVGDANSALGISGARQDFGFWYS